MITDGDKGPKGGPELTCRQARKLIRGQGWFHPQSAIPEDSDSRLRSHLSRCARCEGEARVQRLYRVILTGDSGTVGTAYAPDAAWFRGLSARIERENSPKSLAPEDSFAAIVSLVARQMVPVMVALILLIVGATLFWTRAPVGQVNNYPVLMNQVVEYPQPTSDDVLGTLLAVEDKKNGK
jgi:hypothetical protein